MTTHCHQVNLQTGWGGGEVYSVFFTRALLALGIPTTLYVHQDNPGWAHQLPTGATVVRVAPSEIVQALEAHRATWILGHSPLSPGELAALRRQGRLLTCIAHMPLYGRDPARLAAHDYVAAVSAHVLESLRAAGILHTHPEPLLGIADLRDNRPGPQGEDIRRQSPYDWDMRKGRDRLLSWLYPFYERHLPEIRFSRRPGLTLGIVSRLTPIKQFPLLFALLTPVLLRHPGVNLEIFGAGGYASVRDLKRALGPLGDRVRYWGHQTDVRRVYRTLDYLMTGLPEKEALGLNVIEAQACGTPVVAPNAKPFTETIAEEITGLFYRDPREDQGASFDTLLHRLLATPFRIDASAATAHLARFSEGKFRERVGRLAGSAQELLKA